MKYQYHGLTRNEKREPEAVGGRVWRKAVIASTLASFVNSSFTRRSWELRMRSSVRNGISCLHLERAVGTMRSDNVYERLSMSAQADILGRSMLEGGTIYRSPFWANATGMDEANTRNNAAAATFSSAIESPHGLLSLLIRVPLLINLGVEPENTVPRIVIKGLL